MNFECGYDCEPSSAVVLLGLIGASVAFAFASTLILRRRRARALIPLLLVWYATGLVYIITSMPSPERSLHSFERSPAPACAFLIVGSLAALAIARRSLARRVVLSVALAAAGNLIAGAAAYLVVLLLLVW